MLALEMKENNNKFSVHPYTINLQKRPYNFKYAKRICKFINRELKCKLNPIHTRKISVDKCQLEKRRQAIFSRYTYEDMIRYKFDAYYTGITKIDMNIAQLVNDRTPMERTSAIVEPEGTHFPWKNFTKKDLANLYEVHDLLDTLFPLTRSCEGEAEETMNFTKHCGRCWWCQERMWAFGKL